MSRAYAAKGLEYLEDAVDGLFSGYNLGNGRILKLFNALTGKQIQAEPFWQELTKSAARRNDAVHGGTLATEQDAKESLRATSALVAYLG